MDHLSGFLPFRVVTPAVKSSAFPPQALRCRLKRSRPPDPAFYTVRAENPFFSAISFIGAVFPGLGSKQKDGRVIMAAALLIEHLQCGRALRPYRMPGGVKARWRRPIPRYKLMLQQFRLPEDIRHSQLLRLSKEAKSIVPRPPVSP